jgi:hypothetical protein
VSEYKVKRASADVHIKSSGSAGLASAVVATFNVVDTGGDMSTPETFTSGEEIIVSPYNHSSMHGYAVPVGKGITRVTPTELIVDVEYFMQNQSGREAFEVVKQMGASQEWSFGYKIWDQEPTNLGGRPVNLLKRVQVFECSPCHRGAGVNTRTLTTKERAQAEAMKQFLRYVRDRHCPGAGQPAPAMSLEARETAARQYARFVQTSLRISQLAT